MELFIDADNAMGSPSGDVDDGFAVAALLSGDEPVAALASVRGNTSEELAARNNRTLAEICGYTGPLLRGATRIETPGEASRFILSEGPALRYVAFGPLTNLASALHEDSAAVAQRVREVIIVGSNVSSRGRWPPVWPHEFNLTKDPPAARVVFGSGLPLVFGPLDVLRNMTVTRQQLNDLPGVLGEYLRDQSQRWLRRAALVKWSRSFPVWDLVTAMYALGEPAISTQRVKATFHRRGWIEYGAGATEVTLIRDFNRDMLWRGFRDLVTRNAASVP